MIPHNAHIKLHCGNESFANLEDDDDHVSSGPSSIEIRCLHDQTFQWSQEKREFRKFHCLRPPSYTVESTGQVCGSGARLYRVGYRLAARRFVHTLELCHDKDQLRTHYTFYQLLPANEHFQQHVKRITFSTGGHFHGYNMDRLYTQANQKRRVEELQQTQGALGALGATAAGEFVGSLFDERAGLFLARGHLAAKSDLIYASQQRCSFNYMNVAPQWQSFNGGHWAVVEDATRRFVARSGLSVSVYTGTYGVMPLPDAAGTSFHLAVSPNNTSVLPVPSHYYRLIVDNAKPTRGLALIGVNNPFVTLEQIAERYMLCEPQNREHFTWLQRWLQADNLKKGYLYACTVADVAKVVGHLPTQLQEVHEVLGVTREILPDIRI